MIYTHGVSAEPLESIRSNECDAYESLATSRFRRLWNEIERQRTALESIAGLNGTECSSPRYVARRALQATVEPGGDL